jgi:hypothetical protein
MASHGNKAETRERKNEKPSIKSNKSEVKEKGSSKRKKE